MITIDWSINLTGILSFAVAIGGGIAGWVTLHWKVAQLRIDLTEHQAAVALDFADQQKTVEHYRLEMSTTLGTINGKLEMNHGLVMDRLAANAREVAEFKLDVAKNYAGNTALEKVEQRIVKTIEDLGKRVDGARSRSANR